MATAGFGTPQYEEDEKDKPVGANGAASGEGIDAVAETIDINDPALTSEALDINVDGDAYAIPTPPPDKLWRARLKISKQKLNGEDVDYIPKKNKDGLLHVSLSVAATIIDASGKYDGLHVYDPWVTTVPRKDGSSQVQTILARLKQPNGQPWVTQGAKMSHKAWADLLVKALAGEPEIGVQSEWRWSCQGCGKEAKEKQTDYPRDVRGMHKFPPSPKVKNTYDAEMKCAVNPAHGYSRANVRVASYVPLGEIK